jgi:hypothetical protein
MLFDPGFRPAWHWHIFSSARGIGKDTLANMISTLYGEANVARIGTEAFVDKSNVELFNTGLAIMSDFTAIPPGGKYNSTLSLFKSLTGTYSGRMRAMYKDGVQSSISVRFLMLSNSYNDFPVDENDRRLFKCQSRGLRLDARIYTLANCLINKDKITEQDLEASGLSGITDEDVIYAKALLLEYFEQSGYRDMYTIRDCPQNAIKEENTSTTEPKYFAGIRDAIRHQLFVFSTDIVTEDSVRCMLEQLGVDTSVGLVMRDLIDKKLIRRLTRAYGNDEIAVRIKIPLMKYDRDLCKLRLLGVPQNKVVYAIRNFDEWLDPHAKRQAAREYKKIIGYPNIIEGYDETNAKLLKANKVVPIA